MKSKQKINKWKFVFISGCGVTTAAVEFNFDASGIRYFPKLNYTHKHTGLT
jgi:hypothetical protein